MSVSRAEPDQTPRSAASDLVLHCFLMSHKKGRLLGLYELISTILVMWVNLLV